jgi:hypothetical protein
VKFLDYFRPYPCLKSGIVNLKNNGPSFRGVIWQKRGPFLVLRSAELLQKDGARPLDGEVIVRLADIEFIQVA